MKETTYFDYGEEQHWVDLRRRRVDRNAHLVTEVQRFAREDWYTQFNGTLYDHGISHYNAELWMYMTQMEWDFFAPRE